jgi:DNA-binding MarR family transcriptional regulator
MPANDAQVRDVLRFYPRIYFACHLRHVRARSTEHRLSDRDSMLLGHLNGEAPWNPGELARHMGVAPSTMTETIDRLERLGYVTRARRRREVYVRITPSGEDAMAGTSILDQGLVRELLERLAPADRSRAVRGLGLLAAAADGMRKECTS